MMDQVMIDVFQRGHHEIMESRPCLAARAAWRGIARRAFPRQAMRIGSRPRRYGRPMQPTFTTRPDIRGTFGAVATTHWLAKQNGMAGFGRGGHRVQPAAG